jgi:DNA-binding IclR family transcriptional regulator
MDETDRIAPNLRTLRILEVLGRADHPMTPTEINAELGLPKQTVHRLCTTLISEGYLVRNTSGKGLRPGRRLRLVASGILFASRFHIARHQILVDLAEQVSETVNFVVPEDDGMVYLDRVETDWPFRVQLPIGTAVPFHCTASGKTFLASLAPASRRSMVRNLKLQKLTPNTHGDPDSLLEELDQIASQGFAVDNEEFVEGMVAIAVPIRDGNGRYFASVAFHGPTQRLTIDLAMEKKELLFEVARRLQAACF